MKTLIVVPARYQSSRFPGKPLARIAGRSMLERVAVRAQAAARRLGDARALVATDDQRIGDAAEAAGVDWVMTDPDLPSGSDRALAAVDACGWRPENVLNLQGDAPFTPIDYLTQLVDALDGNRAADVCTPTIRLPWSALDDFRAVKATRPHSGTTCVVAPDGRALWFTKMILPAIRNEAERRKTDALSPVRRHVGLYAYRIEALRDFVATPPSDYERIEGLEQLRLMEAGRHIACVDVAPDPYATSGIDTPADLEAAEALVQRLGDPDTDLFSYA
ncbi:MAG: 3-deoxy-manno-octulosonate cytidylyltransferase [Alphaproteobacteria bacterium]|nr:3-deoxy-manno-octulosonate cytidylyltransferase [Alphaproteobacteria bacterium]